MKGRAVNNTHKVFAKFNTIFTQFLKYPMNTTYTTPVNHRKHSCLHATYLAREYLENVLLKLSIRTTDLRETDRPDGWPGQGFNSC